jgi:hypothetical protein
MVATGGFTVLKTAQNTTAGKNTITLEEPSIEDTNALLAIQKLAIWPAKQTVNLVSSASLAEGLSSPALTIVTPLNVMEILQSNSIPQSVEEMTGEERLQAFGRVAEKAKVDAVFFMSPSGSSSDYALFKLSRASTTQNLTLLIYSREKNEIVWQDVMSVKMEGGGNLQNECTTRLTDHILEIMRKNTSATTNAPNLSVTNSIH